MKVIILTMVITVFVTMMFFRPEKADAANQNYNINLIILVSEAKIFNPDDLIKAFKNMWGITIVCADPKGLAAEDATSKAYLVGNGFDKNNLLLRWSTVPLDKKRTNILVWASEEGFTNGSRISQSDVAALKNHKAYFQLDYIRGPENSKERMTFTAKLLLTLIRLYPVSGYVDSSAQAYMPFSCISADTLKRQDIGPVDLFLLFVNVQTISEKDNTEIHTHGMDQFWLPDIQLVSRKEEWNYSYNVLQNAAIYMIDTGRAMNPGDTSEMAGDGIVFKVVAAKPDRQHPFGSHGAIKLTKQK